MKKSLLLCSTALALGVTTNANAMDFGKNFYGLANATIGYSLQVLDGDLKDMVVNGEDFYDKSKLTHGLTLGVGYNVYYRLNNFINPFIGLNVEGRIPLKSKLYSCRVYDDDDNVGEETIKFKDFFAMHAKLGAKMNLSKNIDVAPYYLIGFNIAKLISSDSVNSEENFSKTKAGLSTGIGVDTILFNRYLVGVEYKYSMINKIANDVKAEGHQIGIKFGAQFL